MIAQGDVLEWKEKFTNRFQYLGGVCCLRHRFKCFALLPLLQQPMRWTLPLYYFIEKFDVSQVHIACKVSGMEVKVSQLGTRHIYSYFTILEKDAE